MSDTNGAPGVYAKLATLQDAVGQVPKNGRNDFHGYDYVLEADLLKTIKPLMNEIGLVLIPSQTPTRVDREVETKNGHDNVACIWHEFRLVDTEDGSFHAFGVWGEGQDGGDKGSYKAFTGAMKYALMKLAGVETGDDPEHDRGVSRARSEIAGPFDLDNKLGFGKHKDLTWREAAGQEPDYVMWLRDNTDRLSPDMIKALEGIMFTAEALDGPDELDLAGPPTPAQKDKITELYLQLAPHLTEEQRTRCKEAKTATEDVAAKTIDWMVGKLESLAAAGA